MPFATGPRGVRIHYEMRGTEGDAAILIQGLGLPSSLWFEVPDRLAAAPHSWRVLLPDHRGVGRSDRPSGPYAMSTLADDVAVVLDDAGIDRAFVVGLSLGGMVAQHLALRHPSRVAGLVLMATTAGFPHAWPPNPLSLLNFLSLPLSGRLNQKHVDRSFARLLLAERDMPRSRELLAGWPAALQNEPTGVAGYAAHLAAVMGHSTGWRLRRIACPTVVVTGDDDALLPHHNSRILAKLIPGAHLEVIPGGHILPAADPACVERGLDRVRRMARGPAGRSHATPIIPAPERKRSAAS